MSHALSTIVDRLRRVHNSALVLIHDPETEHIGYWGKSTRSLGVGALDYMQRQGFTVIQYGVRYCDETGRKQAWAEFRRQAPATTVRKQWRAIDELSVWLRGSDDCAASQLQLQPNA